MIRGWSVKNTVNPPGQVVYKRGTIVPTAKPKSVIVDKYLKDYIKRITPSE